MIKLAWVLGLLVSSAGCTRGPAPVVMPVIDVKVEQLYAVRPGSWDVGERKLCSSRPSAVQPGSKRLLLLCGQTSSAWTTAADPTLNESEPFRKMQEAELREMLRNVKELPVILAAAKADHIVHESAGGEPVTLTYCTKEATGVLRCE